MALVPRPPLALRSRATLRKVNTRGIHYDFFNYETWDVSKYFTDFLGSGVPPEFTTGGAGTAAAITANAIGGAADLAMSSNGSSIYLSNKNWVADQNCTLAARFKLSAITALKCELGFVDTNGAGIIGATGLGAVTTLAATPVLTATVSSATCVMFDTTSALSTPTNWRLVGAQGGTTKLTTPSTSFPAAIVAPVAATYQTIVLQLRRVAVAAEDVDAEFWVNGTSMGVMRSGANTYNTQMYPYLIVYSASAARTLTCDWFGVWQDRDVTA